MKIIPANLLCQSGLCISRNEGRRLVVGGIAKLNGEPITNITEELEVQPGDELTVGKHRKVKITQEMLEKL